MILCPSLRRASALGVPHRRLLLNGQCGETAWWIFLRRFLTDSEWRFHELASDMVFPDPGLGVGGGAR